MVDAKQWFPWTNKHLRGNVMQEGGGGFECCRQSKQRRGAARTLTDGGLHNHGLGVVGTQTVARSVERLHSKHVVCSGGQAVAHEPVDAQWKRLVSSSHLVILKSVNQD